jgi:hypothetical protein
MKILREKLFGKLDALEAKRLGISVTDLRRNRASINETGTVHDLINSGGNSALKDNGISFKKEIAQSSKKVPAGTSNQAIKKNAYLNTKERFAEKVADINFDIKRNKAIEQINNKDKMISYKNQRATTVPSTPVKPAAQQSGIKSGIKAGTWVKNNRMAIAGTALATAAAIGAYKHYKNKKKNSEDNK